MKFTKSSVLFASRLARTKNYQKYFKKKTEKNSDTLRIYKCFDDMKS